MECRSLDRGTLVAFDRLVTCASLIFIDREEGGGKKFVGRA